MRHRQSTTAGFTLIETLIALAIVALLMAVALPAYHSYDVRAKVAECINLSAVPKIIVTESHLSGRGADFQFSQTRHCDGLQIAEDGSIVMQTRDTGASTDPLLQLVPSVGPGGGSTLNWECQLVAGNPKHVPPECRNSGTMANIGDAHANGVSVAGSSSASSSSSASTGGTSVGSSSGSGSSDSGSSGSGSSGSGSSDTGSSDTGSSGSGSSDTGSSGSGSSDTGSSGSGSSDTGSSGSGSSGSGSSDTGSSGSGSSGSGSSDTGSSSGGGSSGSGTEAPGSIKEDCPILKKNGKPDKKKCKEAGYT